MPGPAQGVERMAWNRRSSRFEGVLPRSSDERKQRPNLSHSSSSYSSSGRAFTRTARTALICLCALLLVLVLARSYFRSPREYLPSFSSAVSSSSTSSDLNSELSSRFFENRWPSSNLKLGKGRMPEEWALRAAEAILPDTRGNNADWEQDRLVELAKILQCRAKKNCTHKQKHVVLSGIGRWKWSLDQTFDRPAFFPNGEAVLGKSWINSIQEMGYPFIHIADFWGGENSVSTISRLYRAIGENVAVVMLDYVAEGICYRDEQWCRQSEQNPEGIPEYKIFMWDPLAAVPQPWYREPWGLKTFPLWPDAKATYIGFEMESSCEGIPFTAPADRENMIYIFGKEKHYYDPERNWNAWKNETYLRIIKETGVRIEAGILDNDESSPIPDGVTNVGTESRNDFMRRIAKAKLVLGVGLPHESPTPMEGLCAGTPFINPELNPGWYQHPMLGKESPPYVYNVPARDEDKLLEAIKQALANPLHKSFIPELATKASFKGRLEKLITGDWKTKWEIARKEYLASQEA